MPLYEYKCNRCGRQVNLFFKTYAAFDQGEKLCSHCGSADLKRLISRVAVARSDDSRAEGLADDQMLSALDENDPRSLGKFMRSMSAEMGEELGDEFGEVVDRLEKGQAPEEIEKAMPGLADGGGESTAAADDD